MERCLESDILSPAGIHLNDSIRDISLKSMVNLAVTIAILALSLFI